MIAKFMTKYIEKHEVSTQLKNELTHLANCCIYKYAPSKSSLKTQNFTKIKIIITHSNKDNGIFILNRSDISEV